MKLRNKKTGEIHEITEVVPLHDMDKKFVIYSQTEGHNHAYKNLAELNEEWEDYEEPRSHWSITQFGDVVDEVDGYMSETIDDMKQIGNYFETKEEAEKAVEKLKAYKRLKNKGFRFLGCGFKVDDKRIIIKAYCLKGFINDLNLLFGGEE